MCQQQADLLQHESRRELRQPDKESRESFRPLGILGIERLSSNFPQDFVAELSVVEFLREDG